MPGLGVFSIGVHPVFGRGKGSNFMSIPRLRASPWNSGARGFLPPFFCKNFQEVIDPRPAIFLIVR